MYRRGDGLHPHSRKKVTVHGAGQWAGGPKSRESLARSRTPLTCRWNCPLRGHRAFAGCPDLRDRFSPAGPFSSLPEEFSKGFVSSCLSFSQGFQFRDSFFNFQSEFQSCPFSRNTVYRSCITVSLPGRILVSSAISYADHLLELTRRLYE